MELDLCFFKDHSLDGLKENECPFYSVWNGVTGYIFRENLSKQMLKMNLVPDLKYVIFIILSLS